MVETIRLESGHTLTGIVGSNPTLSARIPTRFQRYIFSDFVSGRCNKSKHLRAFPVLRPLAVCLLTYIYSEETRADFVSSIEWLFPSAELMTGFALSVRSCRLFQSMNSKPFCKSYWNSSTR